MKLIPNEDIKSPDVFEEKLRALVKKNKIKPDSFVRAVDQIIYKDHDGHSNTVVVETYYGFFWSDLIAGKNSKIFFATAGMAKKDYLKG